MDRESIPTVITNTTVRPGYQPQAADTNIDADIYLFARLRQLALQQRIEMAIAHNRGVRKLCLAGIKSRHRGAPLEEIRLQFARAVLSEKFPPGFPHQGGVAFKLGPGPLPRTSCHKACLSGSAQTMHILKL